MAGRWYDVQQAAEVMGISTEAVRKRAARGNLESRRSQDGRVQVRLDNDKTESGPEPQTEGGAVVDELRDRLRFVEGQLEVEQEARRRADTIIAQLTQANATLASRIPQLEAPQQGQESAQEPEQGEAGVQDRGEPESRPWWRRVFGG